MNQIENLKKILKDVGRDKLQYAVLALDVESSVSLMASDMHPEILKTLLLKEMIDNSGFALAVVAAVEAYHKHLK